MNTLKNSNRKKWSGWRLRNPEKIEELRKSGRLQIEVQKILDILEAQYPELARKKARAI